MGINVPRQFARRQVELQLPLNMRQELHGFEKQSRQTSALRKIAYPQGKELSASLSCGMVNSGFLNQLLVLETPNKIIGEVGKIWMMGKDQMNWGCLVCTEEASV